MTRLLNLPGSFINIASTEDVENAAFKLDGEDTYGIQFHPEVTHSEEGKILLRNFVVHICGCGQDWTPDIFVESTVDQLKKKLGDDKVVLGLSGGRRLICRCYADPSCYWTESLLHLRG